MSYEKQTWVTGEVITAEKLNHIEDGIESNCSSGFEPYDADGFFKGSTGLIDGSIASGIMMNKPYVFKTSIPEDVGSSYYFRLEASHEPPLSLGVFDSLYSGTIDGDVATLVFFPESEIALSMGDADIHYAYNGTDYETEGGGDHDVH